ncbi:Ubiquitin carboxyl-terminal hydrolase 12 [Vitis vinifera]|uniref:ubiquitinyl hydrolase 1 n=1 Tax=Vitis vinifera TaxID=29760 RepID=A0A438DSG4_VITVI|nr:Ubiquitin carboxyl-terminal hydrolase 12 [Vitis vinifera]
MLWVSLQVGQLREASTKVNNAELKLFLEVELGPDWICVLFLHLKKTKEDILLFFKLYDPEKEELRYVGRLFVKSSGKPIEILTKLNEMAGFAPDEEIELYEEIKFEPCVMCEHLAKRTSFRFSQIEDGDIICFQKSAPPESEEQCRYSDVTSFLEYVQNRQMEVLLWLLSWWGVGRVGWGMGFLCSGGMKVDFLAKRPPIGSTLQAFLGLGWGGGKILEKTDYVTEMILIKKRKANTNKKYFLSSPKMVVHFRALERPKEDDFCLELSKLHNYDDVVERVARRLGLDDPSKIRLTSHNCYSSNLSPNQLNIESSDILYYEVLDIPLPELQGLKNLKVAFHHATKDDVIIHNIRLPKQSTVGDVINELKTKVELSHPNAELRLLEVFYHKIYKIFPPSEKIENINDQYWTLRAEEASVFLPICFLPLNSLIPEEEKNLGPHDRLIHVYHFTKETVQNQMQVQNFGEPFFLIIHEGETLAEVKERIQKKLQVPDEEFSKVSLCPSSLLQYAAAVTNHEHTLTHTWKFAFLSLGRPEYLQDSDIVSSRFQRRDVYGAWEQYLGLEHSDTAPKRAYAANQNRHTFEKPVKIYN